MGFLSSFFGCNKCSKSTNKRRSRKHSGSKKNKRVRSRNMRKKRSTRKQRGG